MAAPSRPPTLRLGTRASLRVRHAGRLARQVGRLSAQRGAWWIIPVVTLLVLIAAAITTTSAALPVAVYALF